MQKIYGYAFPPSVRAGKSINLYFGTFVAGDTKHTLTAHRSGSGHSFEIAAGYEPRVQNPALPQWEGFDWDVSLPFPVPGNAPSGLYYVISKQDESKLLPWFVVKPAGQSSRVAAIVPIATQNAYGYGVPEYPRNNLYGPGWQVAGRAHRVSFARATAHDSLSLMYTPMFTRWAESVQAWSGETPPAIDYYSSLDLHEVGLRNDPRLSKEEKNDLMNLDAYDLLIIYGHDEYWSKEMRDNVEAFVRRGGNLVSLSGNTCHRQVRFMDEVRERPSGTIILRNAMMVCVKDPSLETSVPPEEVTGSYHEPPVSRPPNTMLGVGFLHGGMHNLEHCEYSVQLKNPQQHWAFANTSIDTYGKKFGKGLFTYEVDGTGVEQHDGTGIGPYWVPTAEDGTPRTFTPLAVADLRPFYERNAKPCIAVMGAFVRGGTVFTASTAKWIEALDRDTRPTVEPAISAETGITRNVIRKLRERRDWSQWEEIGVAQRVKALSAVDGRLCAYTTLNQFFTRFPVGAEIFWCPLVFSDPRRLVPDPSQIDFLAGIGTRLFAAAADGRVWRLGLIQEVVPSAAPGKPLIRDAVVPEALVVSALSGGQRITGLAGAGGMLFAACPNGSLLLCSPDGSPSPATWTSMKGYHASNYRVIQLDTPERRILAMTSYGDALYASTNDGTIVRTNGEFIAESERWVDVRQCHEKKGRTTGLAVVDTMLFGTVIPSDDPSGDRGLLAWTDISLVRAPRNWVK